ncbi:MAG: extracellular solute-binding protein, partial [Aristaeellaceae bacterium]
FTSGIAAMTINGSWMISQYSEALGNNLGIVEMPTGSVSKSSANHGIAYATTTANPHMEETIDFLKYLATDEAQVLQCEVVIPASVKAGADWAKVYPNVNVSAFLNAIATYGKPIPLAAQNATPARTAIQEYVGYINYGEYATAQEALDAMAEAVNDALAD